MMRFFLLILLFLLVTSCTEKVEEVRPLIEIYQLNKRIVSHEGKAVEFTDEMTRMDPDFTKAYQGILREIEEGKWTPNGNFIVSKSDLNVTPLISSEDIKGFDFKNDQLVLSSSGCEYFGIIKTIQDPHQDVQLVITINKEPLLNFYKAGTMSRWNVGNAYFVNTCDLVFSDENEQHSNTEITKDKLRFFHGLMDDMFWNKKPNLKQDTTFYNAFKRAGKIIAE